ncbi:rRNA maturation RNase YbeY [Candidatus Uhrbacteria bacterium]|nr:rRNA maturation RNase YbeY [Candidatus Uhrbacteria bacterium]
MASIDIARLVRTPLSDAAVRRIITTTMARLRPTRLFSPPPNGRGSERGRGVRRGGAGHTSISVAFVGPRRMRELNRTYHGEDRVTDILAFRTKERRTQERRIRPIQLSSVLQFFSSPSDLGELILCPPYVRQQAARAGESFRRELTRVLVHGTLHLLGYDHRRPHEAEAMFHLQERLVSKLH